MMIVKFKTLLITIFGLILIIAGFLKHQASCDLDEPNPKDLKKLHNINDLFMIH